MSCRARKTPVRELETDLEFLRKEKVEKGECQKFSDQLFKKSSSRVRYLNFCTKSIFASHLSTVLTHSIQSPSDNDARCEGEGVYSKREKRDAVTMTTAANNPACHSSLTWPASACGVHAGVITGWNLGRTDTHSTGPAT
ncbi:hypothetical protein NPIL_530111 [Nephila pilipes]|uniref:Uncharacterized protein n=1 Tax=Nephila pilipes TaxID=299642 RepID=A0A8X6T0U7_NEPPI|nr:hypothetical protein NPIL_530111 [Nephila pilipes]